MTELEQKKKVELPKEFVDKIKESIDIYCVQQKETLEVMTNAFKSHSCIHSFFFSFFIIYYIVIRCLVIGFKFKRCFGSTFGDWSESSTNLFFRPRRYSYSYPIISYSFFFILFYMSLLYSLTLLLVLSLRFFFDYCYL